MKRLLDTNAVIYLLAGRLAEPLPEGEYLVSVITEMELFSYSADPVSGEQIRQFLKSVAIIELPDGIKWLAAEVRREYKVKLPDAIIAATAIFLDAELLTNDRRMQRIPGLAVRTLAIKNVAPRAL